VTVRLSHVAPVLASPDVEATLAFCEDKLGFRRQWTEGTPPTDAAVKRDGAGLIFFLDAELAECARGITAIIFLSGVEELYAEHRERGAPIILPINDNDGLRSYVVELPPGYHLRFAEGLELIAQRKAEQ
jgi:catechol 2,3-dioxygenase-like lactoylglutathione lyase family enzyme